MDSIVGKEVKIEKGKKKQKRKWIGFFDTASPTTRYIGVPRKKLKENFNTGSTGT